MSEARARSFTRSACSAPPPVADADAIYPPSQGSGGGFSTIGPAIGQAWPGYEYRMLNVKASQSRLAFAISYNEILRPWCELQTPAEGSSSCLPEWTQALNPSGTSPDCTISGPGLSETVVPCFKLLYCSASTCLCKDGACDAWTGSSLRIFELHWDGPALEGTVDQTRLIFLDPVR